MNQTELARLFGVHPRTIRAWQAQGCPVAEKAVRRGQAAAYNPTAVIRWREERAALAASGEIAAMDMEEARRRKLAAEAALVEIDLAKAKDEVVDVTVVSKVIGEGLAAVRARLLQIGAKVAPQLEIVPDATAAKEIVDAAIHEALDEISGPNFAAFDMDEEEEDDG